MKYSGTNETAFYLRFLTLQLDCFWITAHKQQVNNGNSWEPTMLPEEVNDQSLYQLRPEHPPAKLLQKYQQKVR